MKIQLASLSVPDQDEAIRFFVDAIGFELVEDSPAAATDGAPKRWVVVRPPGAETGIVLVQDPEHRPAQRVVLFLAVDDFAVQHRRMVERGVVFREEPRHEPYGTVAVWEDVAGNRWDLVGP